MLQEKEYNNGDVTTEMLPLKTVSKNSQFSSQEKGECDMANTSTTVLPIQTAETDENNCFRGISPRENRADPFKNGCYEISTSDSVIVNGDNGPQSILKLEKYGITVAVIKSLLDYGYSTVESVACTPKNKLASLKGVGPVKADQLLSVICQIVPMGFTTADHVYQDRIRIIRLTTGSKELDRILGGGIETGSLTEVAGESSTGKTQLCHTLAVTCQLPSDANGGEGKCLYIASEATFRPERLGKIAQRFNLSKSEVLKNIVIARAYSSDHQMLLIQEASRLMTQARYAILIVDSVMAHYRTDYAGLAELHSRQTHLGQCLRKLLQIADEFGVAVVITNQVTARMDELISTDGNSNKPVGGNVLAHACTTRLFLKRAVGNKRICKLCFSPLLPEAEASFIITSDGVTDE